MKNLIGLFFFFGVPVYAADCYAPWGELVPNGRWVEAFMEPNPPRGWECRSEMRMCNNGFLSGFYSYRFCFEDLGCDGPFGYVPNGGSVQAFRDPFVQSPERCEREVRMCWRGQLSGSYQYASCSEAP